MQKSAPIPETFLPPHEGQVVIKSQPMPSKDPKPKRDHKQKTIKADMVPTPSLIVPPYEGQLMRQDSKAKPKILAKEYPLPAVRVKVVPIATSTTQLSELGPLEKIHINRRRELYGIVFSRGKRSQFFVTNENKEIIYKISEENSWWTGYLCFSLRPLRLSVVDSLGAEVMRINRPYAFTTRIMPCALQAIKVYSPPGHLIGAVNQMWSVIKPQYLVTNKHGEEVFMIYGPAVTITCCRDVTFHIHKPDGTLVGTTHKRWEGFRQAFVAPYSDKFGLSFEVQLTQVEKALLLASSLLIDFMHFDN